MTLFFLSQWLRCKTWGPIIQIQRGVQQYFLSIRLRSWESGNSTLQRRWWKGIRSGVIRWIESGHHMGWRYVDCLWWMSFYSSIVLIESWPCWRWMCPLKLDSTSMKSVDLDCAKIVMKALIVFLDGAASYLTDKSSRLEGRLRQEWRMSKWKKTCCLRFHRVILPDYSILFPIGFAAAMHRIFSCTLVSCRVHLPPVFTLTVTNKLENLQPYSGCNKVGSK